MGIYNDSTSFGKFIGIIRTFVLFVIAVVCFSFGIYDLVTKETVHTDVVSGVVKSATCSLSSDTRQTLYVCDVTFDYSYNGVSYSVRQAITGKAFNVGETVSLYINKDSPMNVSVNKTLSKHTTGWVLLGVGALFSLFTFLSWYSLRYRLANSATAWTTVFRGFFR